MRGISLLLIDLVTHNIDITCMLLTLRVSHLSSSIRLGKWYVMSKVMCLPGLMSSGTPGDGSVRVRFRPSPGMACKEITEDARRSREIPEQNDELLLYLNLIVICDV